MKKGDRANLRIKRRHLVWLKDAKGLSAAAVDRAAASIDRYDAHAGGADFRAFHAEQAGAFKKHLATAKNPRTGRPLAASAVDGALRDLKAFFVWLADQAGYRPKLSHAEAAYFSPSRRIAKSVRGGLWRPHPSPEQVRHVLRCMPGGTLVERRDGAILAMLLLTIKYKKVYLWAYASVSEARASIRRYLGFYNDWRPHSSLDGKAPDQAYFNALTLEAAAA
jgi:transposase InsO family protein